MQFTLDVRAKSIRISQKNCHGCLQRDLWDRRALWKWTNSPLLLDVPVPESKKLHRIIMQTFSLIASLSVGCFECNHIDSVYFYFCVF